MPGTIIFLANVRDPTDPTVTFGAGHMTDYDVEDDAWVALLWSEGKVAILNQTDVQEAQDLVAQQLEQLEPPYVWPGMRVSGTG